MTDFLSRRFDRPLAWAMVCGGCLLVPCAALGYAEDGPVGALAFGAAGLTAGMIVGLVLGGAVWLVCRAVGLDRPVRRPELWALHLRCPRCDWHTTPEGPWTVRDSLEWPSRCPRCSTPLVMPIPDCPRCGLSAASGSGSLERLWSMVRVPRSLGEALWGHYRCRECQCVFDKWGREVPVSDTPDAPQRGASE